MKNFINHIAILLVFYSSVSCALPTKHGTSDIEWGRLTADQKVLRALNGLGGSNPTIIADPAQDDWNFNKSIDVTGDLDTSGALGAGTTVTGGTGVTASTGDVTATLGDVVAGDEVTAVNNITSSSGNVSSTSGSVSAGTTVTAGTDITATAGNIDAALGNVTSGGSIDAGTTISSAGNATFGGNTATVGDGLGSDKFFIFDEGSGASNPLFRWLDSTSKLQFCNSGTGSCLDIGSAGGANTALSNLTSPTAINQDLIPASSAIDLGGGSDNFGNGFIKETFATDGTTLFGSLRGAIVGNGHGTFNDGVLRGLGAATGATEEPFGVTTENQTTTSSRGLDFITGSNTTAKSGDNVTGTGNVSAGTADSGDIINRIGTSFGGARGSIINEDGSEGTIGHIWTSKGVNGEGGWEEAAAGAGGGGAKSFIIGDNSNFEGGIGDWVNYEDAVPSAIPETGAGGTPAKVSIVQTVVAGEVLAGTTSAKIEKLGAGTALGEGVSVEFDIDVFEQGRVIQIPFKYKTGAGYIDEHYRVFVYDITNDTTPVPVTSSGGDGSLVTTTSAQFIGTFQAAVDSTAYRLIIHSTTADVTAFDIFIDSVEANPESFFGVPIQTEWESFTPILTNFGTTSGEDFEFRQDGPDMLIRGEFTTGTVASVAGTLTIPDGRTIATSGAAQDGFGDWRQAVVNAANFKSGSFGVASTTTVHFIDDTSQQASTGGPFNPANADVLFSDTTAVTVTLRVPIVEFNAGAILSSFEINQQTIIVESSHATATSLPNATLVTIPYDTEIKDTHNSFNPTTGIFTAPSTKSYFFSAAIAVDSSANWTDGETAFIQLYKNGSLSKYLFRYEATVTGTEFLHMVGTAQIEMVRGDTASVRVTQNTGAAGAVYGAAQDVNLNYISIHSLPDFRFIGARPSKLPTVQTFTADGTYTKPAGLIYVKVKLVAGGGAGGGSLATGGSDYSSGGGGAGGGSSEELIDASLISDGGETVTIGAGGTGGTGNGPAGTSTSFGSLLSATGGAGGISGFVTAGRQVASGGIGGIGSGGDTNMKGGSGTSAWSEAVIALAIAGNGGDSLFSGITRGGAVSSGVEAGINALSPGGGGSGAALGNSQSAQDGGDGFRGELVVEEFY